MATDMEWLETVRCDLCGIWFGIEGHYCAGHQRSLYGGHTLKYVPFPEPDTNAADGSFAVTYTSKEPIEEVRDLLEEVVDCLKRIEERLNR